EAPLPLWAAAESLPPVGETAEPMTRLIRLTGQLRAAALAGQRPDPARLAPMQDRLAALIAARGTAAARD
ncbi:MAG: hypothetical protein IE927_16250, partial [Rhodobacterales bacterium]|nr:hypothetical protein [Rhodobacterales bacterium]